MCIEPIELWLDTRALRRGLVYPIDPDTDPSALLVQDSGMVPVSTQIAIVNPETCRLCHIGEYGEIWVQSEACVHSFYGSKDAFDAERFSGRTVDGDPRVTYVRTGDLGFLHNVTRPIGPNGSQVEMQVLFVLGGIGETFEVNGLSHFPMDIEYSVEKCHRNIVPAGWYVSQLNFLPSETLILFISAVFQAGGLVVVLVEVMRKAYLASIVPVIVNAILNEHQLVVDIVAFVSKGDFPRSRLGEKQRGKILASWVTRKMHTIAQFSIRDPDGADSQITEVPETQMSNAPSFRRGSVSTVDRRQSIEPGIPPTVAEQHQFETHEPEPYASIPTGISEMPGDYEALISDSPPPPQVPAKDHLLHPSLPPDHPHNRYDPDATPHAELAAFDYDPQPPPPRSEFRPAATVAPDYGHDSLEPQHDINRVPSQLKPGRGNGPSAIGPGAGLHVANVGVDDERGAWGQEAMMHMNLAGAGDGRGYGGIGSASGYR